MDPLILGGAAVLLVVLVAVVLMRRGPSAEEEAARKEARRVENRARKDKAKAEARERKEKEARDAAAKQQAEEKKRRAVPSEPASKPTAVVKGMKGGVTAMSASARHGMLAVATGDRVINVFTTASLATGQPFSRRVNVPLDCASAVAVSDDGDAAYVAAAGERSRSVTIFGVKPRVEQIAELKSFETEHTETIVSLALDAGEKRVFSCAATGDTTVRMFDVAGTQLASVDTRQVANSGVVIAPGFVSVAAFTKDVRIFATADAKGNAELRRIMALSGHTSRLSGVAFVPGTSHMVTCSRDGTWRVWTIDVRWEVNEDPRQLASYANEDNGAEFDGLAVCPAGRLVALRDGGDARVSVHEIETGKRVARFILPMPCAHMAWTAANQLVTASSESVAFHVWTVPSA